MTSEGGSVGSPDGELGGWQPRRGQRRRWEALSARLEGSSEVWRRDEGDDVDGRLEDSAPEEGEGPHMSWVGKGHTCPDVRVSMRKPLELCIAVPLGHVNVPSDMKPLVW